MEWDYPEIVEEGPGLPEGVEPDLIPELIELGAVVSFANDIEGRDDFVDTMYLTITTDDPLLREEILTSLLTGCLRANEVDQLEDGRFRFWWD